MTRMLTRPMALVTLLVVTLGMVQGAPAFAAEQRHVVVTGRHTIFGNFADTGVVTFIARTDDTDVGPQDGGGPSGSGKGKGPGALLPSQAPWWQRALAMLSGEHDAFADGKGKGEGNESGPDFAIKGNDATLNRVDGRNHDLNGNVVGSGDRSAVALDVAATELTYEKVTLQGSAPIIRENIPSIEVESSVVYLTSVADTTYTSDTTLNNTNIGGAGDYKVVVVKDANLTLKGTSTGYGVLVVYDTHPGNGHAMLKMEDAAKWYGVILVYSGDSGGNSDKTKLQFGKQNNTSCQLPSQEPWWQRALTLLSGERPAYADGGKGKGCTAGLGVQVYGAIIAEGREVTLEFPSNSVADVFYSSSVITNSDAMLYSKKFSWEDWRER